LYTNDVILFLSPMVPDLELASNIFKIFEGASGLTCNMSKCQTMPIRCEPSYLELATSFLPCTVTEFPVRYLGVPLSVMTLSRAACQRLIDGMANRLPMWKGSLMHKSGRLALIKSTLVVMLVHTTISLELPAWVRKAMVKIMHCFLWSRSDTVRGGKCSVACHLVQRLLNLGGLDILDLRITGMSLRLRWFVSKSATTLGLGPSCRSPRT
jgi:hypothetical protein